MCNREGLQVFVKYELYCSELQNYKALFLLLYSCLVMLIFQLGFLQLNKVTFPNTKTNKQQQFFKKEPWFCKATAHLRSNGLSFWFLNSFLTILLWWRMLKVSVNEPATNNTHTFCIWGSRSLLVWKYNIETYFHSIKWGWLRKTMKNV